MENSSRYYEFNKTIGFGAAILVIGLFIGVPYITGFISAAIGYMEHKEGNNYGTVILAVSVLSLLAMGAVILLFSMA